MNGSDGGRTGGAGESDPASAPSGDSLRNSNLKPPPADELLRRLDDMVEQSRNLQDRCVRLQRRLAVLHANGVAGYLEALTVKDGEIATEAAANDGDPAGT